MVSIGLFASLLPQTSFVPQPSGGFADATGPLWPDYSVEQPLDGVPDVISEVRIWARAGFDRGEGLIVASLLQGRDYQLVRQLKFPIKASRILRSYVLTFPSYQPAPGEKLVLQLWVSKLRSDGRPANNHVIFGTSEPGTGIAPLTLNGRPTGHGALAHEFIWTGAGWRAALEGSIPDIARLAGAIAAALAAVALHPVISRTLRKTTQKVRIVFLTVAGPIHRTLRRARISRISQLPDAQAPSGRRGFYIFPWLIPAFAILHYLASNRLLFRVSDSIAVAVVVLAIVTAAFIAFRLVFKTAAVAAMLTGLLGIAFFSYGHVYVALGDHADDRYLMGLGIPTVLGLGALVPRRAEFASRIGSILNFASVVLLAAPLYQIAVHIYAATPSPTGELSHESAELDERVAEAKARITENELRDIYYIILDKYPRSGSPPEFDNSDFINELEARGFYVAPQARSNYVYSFHSIPSSLNMRYVGKDNEWDDQESRQLLEMADDHALGRILKALGYNYVHVSAGWLATETSRNADLVVDFAPSGRLLSRAENRDPFSLEKSSSTSGRFTSTFLRTTAARPFLSHEFSAEHDGPYGWTHPFRTLAWLDFMKEVGTMERPKFVFAHVLKPHEPTSFDRSGNITFDYEGWTDDHDPTVPGAFYGQVIWLNDRMLEVIDAILDEYEEPPIIVIAGDHGHGRSVRRDILAAFLLPEGGESALYPSITSVNHFRAILDYYFGLNLGLLEDRVY